MYVCYIQYCIYVYRIIIKKCFIFIGLGKCFVNKFHHFQGSFPSNVPRRQDRLRHLLRSAGAVIQRAWLIGSVVELQTEIT